MKFAGKTGEYFEVTEFSSAGIESEQKEGVLTLVWFEEDDNHIIVDGKTYRPEANSLISYTWLHKVEFVEVNQVKCLRFNSPFYCILDHDSEVGCKGILFFGSRHLPIIKPDSEDLDRLKLVWKVLKVEMQSVDNLQLEMLQMMLKRIIILCTRIYKSQHQIDKTENSQVDIIREFNFLVEQHFKEKHTVADYAELLNKSPKTISNLFGKLYHKTPLQLIQDRKMLEARRLLKYTDRAVSEVAYHIGFNDIQSFSRFFKKHELMSPSDYRES